MVVSFLVPQSPISPEVVQDTLSLVMKDLPDITVVKCWTKYELIVAYDWAMREYLDAGDHEDIKRRDKPWFLSQGAREEKHG